MQKSSRKHLFNIRKKLRQFFEYKPNLLKKNPVLTGNVFTEDGINQLREGRKSST